MPPKADGKEVSVQNDDGIAFDHPKHIDCYEFDDDDAAKLNEELIGKGLTDYFVDTLFAGIDAIYFDGLRPPQGALPADLIQWKPLGKREVLGVDSPFLFKQENGEVVVGCVEQGQLNDRWFLNAVAGLSNSPRLLQSVFVSSRYSSKGLYTLKFFKDGRWRYLHIDDRIPVDLSGRPIYSHGTDYNEVWVMLLEKAYAKMHGCYESLASGFVDEAMRDLTAGAPLFLDLKCGNGLEMKELGSLWEFLQTSIADNAIVSCTRSSNAPIPRGGQAAHPSSRILSSHAYIVLFAAVVEDPLTKLNIRLLRIRNPWGTRTWSGEWSKRAPQWDDYPKMKSQLQSMLPEMEWEIPDGTFLMTFEDFIAQFDSLSLLYLIPEEWTAERYRGEWLGGSTVSGPGGAPIKANMETFRSNPQYGFYIANESDVHIVLSQKETRWTISSSRYVESAIGFTVCALSDGHLRVHTACPGNIKNRPYWAHARQVCDRFKLTSGNYVIVPCTFDRQKVGEFFLDFFISTPADVFDSMEEDSQSRSLEEGAGDPIAIYEISEIDPDSEDLADLTLKAMQRTISELGNSARSLKEEISDLEARASKLEGRA